ncbi:hypothetical protein GCK32_017476 [Trichostrongylus colubriformis]|uniref:Uncharacterized protein n=1 Tax=Trichostrongylus colubriformis TaxID=6319 RepID=A0AAN8EPR8_TRICO
MNYFYRQIPDEDIKDSPLKGGTDKVITIDDDIFVVHEDIRSKAVEKFRFWNKASFEEAALVVRLSKLMGIGSFDTSDPVWFHILLTKVKEYIRQLDAQNNDAYELMKDLRNFHDCREREYRHLMRKLEEAKNIASEEQQSAADTTSSHLLGSPDTSTRCESEVRSTGNVAPVKPLRTSMPVTMRRSRNSHVIGKCMSKLFQNAGCETALIVKEFAF